MAKLFFASDFHIYDYPDFNITPKFRLNQGMKFAEVLIDLAIKYGVDTLFIAGDISEKSNVRPYIEHAIKVVLEKLGTHFKVVYYILGQHDFDTKSSNQSEQDSFITAIAPSNFHYMDKKEVMIDNTRIAMMNWKPKQDLTWYDGKVNLFVGHYTNDERFGQEIDDTKFDLAITGDIHQKKQIGNICSIGTPMQNKYGDQIEKTIMMYDSVTHQYEWINIDPTGEHFLTLRYTQTREQEGISGMTHYSYRPMALPNYSVTEVATDVSTGWSSLDDLIKELVTKNGLDDIHSRVSSLIQVSQPLSFNYWISDIWIANFRSIREMKLTMTSNEKLVVLGDNGTGKSSFIRAIRDCLFGNKGWRDNTTYGEDYQRNYIKLHYGNDVFEINRGNEWGLSINGVAVGYNARKDFEADVAEKLPFLQYEELMYYSSKDLSPLSRLSTERLMQVISKMYRLDVVDSLNWTAYSISEDLRRDYDTLNMEIDGYYRSNDNLTKSLKSYETVSGQVSDFDNKIQDIVNLKTDAEKYNSYTQQLGQLLTSIAGTRTILDQYKSNVSQIDVNVLTAGIADIDIEIASQSATKLSCDQWITHITNVTNQINSYESQRVSQEANLSRIQSKNCYVCESVLEEAKTLQLKTQSENSIRELQLLINSHKTSLGDQSLEYFVKYKSDIDSSLIILNQKRVASLNSISIYNSSLPAIQTTEKVLSEQQDRFEQFKIQEVSAVSVPLNIDESLRELSQQRSNLSIKLNILAQIDENNNLINTQSVIRTEKWTAYERYVQYFNLTGPTGAIYREMLTRISASWSEGKIRYLVQEWKNRGKDYLDIKPEFRVGNKWIPYYSLSDGQMTLCGIHFFQRLFTGNGLLILDEHLKHLDNNTLVECIDLLRDTKVNNLIISTHSENFNFFTKKLHLRLQGEDTHYMIE